MKINPRYANLKGSDKKLAEFAIENEDFDPIKGKSVTMSRPIPAEPEVESPNCSVPEMSVTRNALSNASSSTGSEVTSETVVVSRTELDNILKIFKSLENENKIRNKIQSETMENFDTFFREAKEDHSCMKNLMLTLIELVEKITPNQDANKSGSKSVNLSPVSMIKTCIFTPEEYDTENTTTHSPVPDINILPVRKDDSNTSCVLELETCKKINRNITNNTSKGLKSKNVVEDSPELASCVADFEDTCQETEETQSTQEELKRNSSGKNSAKLSSIPEISSSGIECHAITENVDEEMIPVPSNSITPNSKKTYKKIYKKPPRPCSFCQKSFVSFKRHVLHAHASEREIQVINKIANKRQKTLEIKKLRMKGLALQNEVRMKRGEDRLLLKDVLNLKNIPKLCA